MIVETFQRDENPVRAVIGLHGLTGDEHSLRPVAIGVHARSARWYFPRAPYSYDHGSGYSWFQGSDETGWEYRDTFDLLHALLRRVHADGYQPGDVYLVGFSQGASLAMEFALRLPTTLGGIVLIAGFIKYPEKLRADATPAARRTPVLILHGELDPVIPPEASRFTRQFFHSLGNPVRLVTYRAGHKIPVRANRLIRDFLEAPDHTLFPEEESLDQPPGTVT
jgi:phospholipase/carboxylesterase